MIKESGTRGAEEAGELGPRVGLAHVDDADRLDPRPRRLDAIGARRLSRSGRSARTDVPPSPKSAGKGICWYRHLDPFAPASDDAERPRSPTCCAGAGPIAFVSIGVALNPGRRPTN
jgi:hypothetical protein